ncbi:MAG TPA: glucose-1-phosphate cytidylyltransferase [Fervidobacterium nodosum]|nr:glucose-1-phosphate cytidylyltransferase [Fervidobacterium nodosum]
MKVVILAGGFGTRLSEETVTIPKPMVEIGGKPILWHIMKIYSAQGFNDFIICLGYKGYVIKEYFLNYFYHTSDITVDLQSGKIDIHNSYTENWKVTLVDTGLNTMTGGRIKRIKNFVGNETFMLTYGDGVSDVNLVNLLNYHKSHGKLATVTAVQPAGRFGTLTIDEQGQVSKFVEKPAGDGAWINGGFFVLEPKIFDYIEGDHTIWEREPLEKLAQEGNLVAYKHYGFWKAMDTLRDKMELEKIWQDGNAPWKIW